MSDLARYYDQSYPPSIYAPSESVPATGANAGIPGTWTPAGSTPPANVTDLTQGIPNVVVANPTTPWTTGQFVQTQTADAAGRAAWTGTGWVGGAAPLEEPEPQSASDFGEPVPVEETPPDE